MAEHEESYGDEGENEWMLDSLKEFFESPLWRKPILNFIDKHCVVFDSEEENKLEYTMLHNQFQQMVEERLDGFLAEFSIPQEVFLNACEAATDKIHQSIIQQMLAVENFQVFKKMMVTRQRQLMDEAAKTL